MSPEQQLERVRMCLAEAGYEPWLCDIAPDGDGFITSMVVPLFVAWRAGAVAGVAVSCWPCRRNVGYVPAGTPRPRCDHPIDPFCAEDAEMVA